MKLVSFCSKKLEEAEQKVTMLIKESNGKYTHQPLDMKEGDEPGEWILNPISMRKER
jgi:hypothetical protein